MIPLARLLSLLTLTTILPAQNQSLAFQNGTTAYADIPFAANLVPSGGVTAEAWVTYDGNLGTGWRFPTILRMDPSPNQASYFLRVEAGQNRANRLLWWVSTTQGNYSIGWTFAAGAFTTWTHVAGTYDGSTLRLIVNGTQVAQGFATGPIQNRGGTLRLGSGDLSVTGGETWNGEIDEVRIWPFARSAAAIAATMNLALSAMPGQVSSWPLDGDVLDSSGSNHGVVTGPATFGPNSPTLQNVAFPGALGFGVGTGCRSTGIAAINSLANLGNASFEFVGTGGPGNAGGLSMLSFGNLPTPQSLFGIDLLIDLNLGITQFVQSNALGTSSQPMAVPSNSAFAGVGFHSQHLWLDPACASGLSASNAVLVILLP